MKLSSLQIFALKLAIFGSALAYMALDLFLWHGPLWHTLHGNTAPENAQDKCVATVYGERITEAQLERHLAEQNLLRGQRGELPAARRTGMLMDMVRSAILRMRARYNDKNLPDYAAEAAAETDRLATRSANAEAFDSQLASQGYTRESFTQKLQAILKATALLKRAVEQVCQVSDEDVARHYELVKDDLTAPEQRPLKHIFFSTLGQDVDAVRAAAQAVLDKITAGEADFATLARTRSEDPHSAPLGGDLGIIARDEHFPLPELPLFGENALPAGQPALAQSRWGWHILLPGELTPARQLTLDETRESLRSAIRSAQFELAVRDFLDQAVRESFHKKHLHINHAN